MSFMLKDQLSSLHWENREQKAEKGTRVLMLMDL